MSSYGYALDDEAVRAFASLPARRREKLLSVFDSLARFPSQKGDYQEAGDSGRLYELKLSEDLMLTWWADHAVREIRIIRIERIE